MGIKNKRKVESSAEQSPPKKLKGVEEQPEPLKEKKAKKDKAKKVNLTKKLDVAPSPPAVALASDTETTPAVKKRKPRTQKADGDAEKDVAAKVERKPLSKKKKKKAKKAVVVEVKPKDETRLQEKSVEYLQLWKDDREAWKFQKLRQIWLTDNMLDSSKISDDLFPTLMEYITGSTGNLIENVIAKANAELQAMEESKDVDVESVKYKRSRILIQTLVTT